MTEFEFYLIVAGITAAVVLLWRWITRERP